MSWQQTPPSSIPPPRQLAMPPKVVQSSGMAPDKPLMHSGPIHSAVQGRTDHLPMNVAPGSYVLPADIISGIGEGNTLAGFKIAKSIFSQPFYGTKSVESSIPYSGNSTPYNQPMPEKATGGSSKRSIPIVAAGGELVIDPKTCEQIGNGSLDDGHKILDEFVKRYRKKLIKTLKKLPGPKKD